MRGGIWGCGWGWGRWGKVVIVWVKVGVKLWVCEKCGGSWKNDIGLKYYKEKVRILCNLLYDFIVEILRRGKKFKYVMIVVDNVLEG